MSKLDLEKAKKGEIAEWLVRQLERLPAETLREFARRVQDGEVDLEAMASTALPPTAPATPVRPDQPGGGAPAA